MDEQHLPPGYRFYPTEDELISFYLHHKLHALEPKLDRVIPSIDIYNFEPPQLPGLAGELCNGDIEQWFFFSPRQEREARGGRPNRTTGSGYWKATGSPSYVYSSENNRVIGMKKTMVFYKGKAPTGRKTKWKMNEYKAIKLHPQILNNPNPESTSTTPELRHELSICRVYITSGCARAFDRRPPGRLLLLPNNIINTNSQNAIPSSSSKEDHHQADGNLTANPSLQNNVKNNATFLLEKSMSSSIDQSSNSGGNYHATLQPEKGAAGSSCGNEIADDLETFWDLEQLHWL